MVFRRLSIFDLAPSGHQPMVSADGRHVVVFNGAIYNFIELRAELAACGHTFRSTGDTEVLLAAYQEWGPKCLSRFNGMWAFAIYDRETRRVFAARDRFGVKPLFWFLDERGLVLTSEIKTLRDSGYARLAPNWKTIAGFLLTERLDESTETFYASVAHVPAGTYFESDGERAPDFHRYWSVDEAAAALPEPSDPVGQFRELFDDAVRLRMRADVPVGVLLSGGLDSTSIICSMAAQRKANGTQTTTLGALCYRDPNYDETSLVSETLRQTGAALWPLEANPAQFWSSLDRHLWHQDEPVHSFTSVVIFELMRLARQRGVKVLLNGQGADEVLAGYANYFVTYWTELVRRGRPWFAHREIKAFAHHHRVAAGKLHLTVLRAVLAHVKSRVPGYRQMADARKRAQLRHNSWVSEDVKRYWQPLETPWFETLTEHLRWSVEHASLPLYLRVEDRNSMAHGVEVRLPFLDHRLVALAFRISSRWKLREEYSKVVLREAMQGRIPEPVRTQVRKFGFPTSTDTWFRDPLYQRCKDLLASRAVRESGIWNVPEIERGLEQHRQGAARVGGRLFDVAQFSAWLSLSKFVFYVVMLMPGLV
jgi:asparagine synthase (glutamine-hydrolysing)